MSPFISYPVTGYWPATNRPCIRCGGFYLSPLYQLCQVCRDADLIIHDAEKIVAERESLFGSPTDDMAEDGYETPMQIRASLGI